MRLRCLGAMIVLAAWLTSAAFGVSQERTEYRLEGVVAEEGTQRRIAGATVRVLVESGRTPEEKLLSGVTDENGRYSIAVPVGHAMVWGVTGPAGYLSVKNFDVEAFATSAAAPVFKKDFLVRRGIGWRVVVRSEEAKAQLPKTYVSLRQVRENDHFNGFCETDEQGRGVITVPNAGGEFEIAFGDVSGSLIAPEGMKLQVEPGFRSDRIAATQTVDAGIELRDEEGRTARLANVTAEIKDAEVVLKVAVLQVAVLQVAVLQVAVKRRPEVEQVAAVGRVVSASGQAVGGARVEAAFSAGEGSATSGVATQTDVEGRFRLRLPPRGKDQKLGVVVTADGHAGVDASFREIPAGAVEVDFGSIRLPAGSSIRIRVVGPGEEPLVGAIVEPGGSYAERERITRTDAEGICTLHDLAAGIRSVDARFGTLSASTKIPLAEGDNELLVLKLNPPRPTIAEPEQPRVALKAGSPAPEWEIAQWTDGRARKLADYRGKVVVLDFWGTWCGPCIQAIPAMQQLHERYADRGVVFLGIHTAGTDVSLVRQMLARRKWDAVSAIDRGETLADGATMRAYGVKGFPTVVIIDREGKVAYHSGDAEDPQKWMQDIKQLAESLKIRWPVPEGASAEEVAETLLRLSAGLYGREIERVLGVGAR